jgi:uncharacterized membrane protein YqjE
MDAQPARGGLLESLRAFGATLADIACVRGALFSVELREEIIRRKDMLVLVALAAVLLHLALVVVTVLVAVVAWDTPYRVTALAAMAGLYLAGGIAAIVKLRSGAASNPAPFAATLGELDRDLANLRSR